MATNKGPTPNFTLKYAHSRIDYNSGTPGILFSLIIVVMDLQVI